MSTKRALPRFVIGLLCIAMIVVLVAAGTTPTLAQGNPPLWFQFNVGSVDAEEGTSHVSVILRDQPQCRGGFQVYTADSWNYWDMPTGGDWMGRSTGIGSEMHMWAGELVPGAYYVHLGSGASPGCALGVSGNAVEYVGVIDRGWRLVREQEPAVESVQVAQTQPRVTIEHSPAAAPVIAASLPAPIPAPAAPAVAAAPVAAAHHDMEMLPNEWMPVTNNDPMRFEFHVGQVREEQSSKVSVTLHSGPFHTGRFEIFTAAGVPFHLPEHGDWFGTADSVDGNYASWYGDLVPGAYYVLVYPEGMKDCMLAVSGQSITF